LNNLEHIDQNEFLNIILKLVKIYKIIILVNLDIKDGKIESEVIQYINWEILNNKLINCIDEMKKTNKILESLIELNKYSIENDKHHTLIKEYINKLSILLAYDFFMYYSSTEIYKILYKKLSFNSDTTSIQNKLSLIIIKYKKYFLQEYRKKYNLYKDLYDEILKSNISKYKLNISNDNFKELVNELSVINNELV
jgi:hypothetical protein